MHIGIFIYAEAEVLDFSGPFEIFTTANRLLDTPLFEVSLIAKQAGVVPTRGGFNVVADYGIDNHPSFDLLIVVGGYHNDVMADAEIIGWLSAQAHTVPLLSSVCTGVFLWAATGILDGKDVTTHHQDMADLSASFPALNVVPGKRWVEHDNFISSAGISAGMDMSLRWLEKLHSDELARKTAKQMEVRSQYSSF
ncbi:DJ-1/PfpI family protein [Halioxenophilus aromaticivorans]|uniref:DJ-1/PfpI family protein n=1 Tax=Halioxenophilus aromaticivorans TaxID=1306992 RepID=A0AAV3TYU7_9ALTE